MIEKFQENLNSYLRVTVFVHVKRGKIFTRFKHLYTDSIEISTKIFIVLPSMTELL